MKYYIREGKDIITYDEDGDVNIKTSDLIQSQQSSIRASDGDLDIIGVTTTYKAYKVFTDTSWDVYLAVGTGNSVDAAINQIKDLNGDNIGSAQKLFGKNVEITSQEAKNTIKNNSDANDLEENTKLITNVVMSVTRNKGTDYTAEWAAGTSDGKWYNEAFDGVYVVKQQTTLTVGFAFSQSRTAVLDPALCPQNLGQADLYTKAYLSQFCLDSQTTSDIANGKDINYIGTFKDQDLYLPGMEEMYVSQKFYIPNANVQDLKGRQLLPT